MSRGGVEYSGDGMRDLEREDMPKFEHTGKVEQGQNQYRDSRKELDQNKN